MTTADEPQAKYTYATAILGGPNQEYRYWLERQWLPDPPIPGPPRTLGGIGFNPSTADATQDDPTIRKMVGFARRWGYTRVIMTNIYAYRSTNWTALQGVADPFGPENHVYLTRVFRDAEIVVCAWGAMPMWEEYATMLTTWAMGQPTARCLGRNHNGTPRHPARIGYETPLEGF